VAAIVLVFLESEKIGGGERERERGLVFRKAEKGKGGG